MTKPRLIVFASGTREGGGSGFENLVRTSRSGELNADVVAVASLHEFGGVRERAERLGVKFVHFRESDSVTTIVDIAALYRYIVIGNEAEWIALSGWVRKVEGLDPSKGLSAIFMIHSEALQFGGA